MTCLSSLKSNWKVADCVIPKDKNDVNKDIDLVSFAEADEAVAAKWVRKRFINAEKRKPPPAVQQETNGRSSDKQRPNHQGARRVKTAPSSKLRIENIPGVCANDDVIGWVLDGHSPDVSGCLSEKDRNGIQMGIVFVTFSSVKQALAINNQLDGTEVFGQEIGEDFTAESERDPVKQHKHLPNKVGVTIQTKTLNPHGKDNGSFNRSPCGFVSTMFRRQAQLDTRARHLAQLEMCPVAILTRLVIG